MADGDPRIGQEAVSAPPGHAREPKYRQLPFIACAGLGLAILGGLLVVSEMTATISFSDPYVRITAMAIAAVSTIPMVLLFRDGENNFERGPGYKLPLFALLLLVLVTLLTVFAIAAASDDAKSHLIQIGPDEATAYVFIWVAAALIPIFWNAVLYHGYRKDARRRRIESKVSDQIAQDADHEDAEAMGALIATLVVAAIAVLATSAAAWGEDVQLQTIYGVLLSIFVIGIFGIVIFLEPLSSLGWVQALGRASKWLAERTRFLARFYGWLDGLLVHFGATVAGMEHRAGWGRYCVLAILLLCLSVLGWCLPPPFGLVTVGIALILAFSVSRLWAWVEDDRALASLTNFSRDAPYRTEMREDYRDETLLGFVFVFALMPIAMYQMNASGIFGDTIFQVPEGSTGFLDWLGFFGIQLAKAVPIVDWAEIYRIGENGDQSIISMRQPASQHAVFLARVTVDLVLIASLLQAVSISSRNRQQKRLYNTANDPNNHHKPGLIDRLDQFVERVEFRRAIGHSRRNRTPSFEAALDDATIRKQIFDLRRLGDPDVIDFRRYNKDRLRQIFGTTKRLDLRVFIKSLEDERPGLKLGSRIELLRDFVEKQASEKELYATLDQLVAEYQRDPFEADIDFDDLYLTLIELRRRSGLEDFKKSLLYLARSVITRRDITARHEALESLTDLAGRSDRNADSFQYTRKACVETIADIAVRSHHADTLRKAQTLLLELRTFSPGQKTEYAIEQALTVLDGALEGAAENHGSDRPEHPAASPDNPPDARTNGVMSQLGWVIVPVAITFTLLLLNLAA